MNSEPKNLPLKNNMNQSKKILLTGGAGFIGSNILETLNSRGYRDIVVVDHLTNTGKWENLRGKYFSDYYDRDDFLKKIQAGQVPGIDAIIHIGACSATTENDEHYLIYNNTKYSKVLADFAAENNCQFLYASSAATYGDGENGYRDTERNLKPLNGYAFSKHLFDQWMLDMRRKPPQWVGFKFFNVYGPNEWHKGRMASMVLHGHAQIKKDGSLKLFRSHKDGYGDGEQKRDFVYIKDVSDVVLFFLENSGESGIFNVGTGQARTFKDLGIAIFRALDLEPNIEFIDMPEDLRERYQYFTEADISSLRKAGYTKEFTSLEEGVRDYVINYLE